MTGGGYIKHTLKRHFNLDWKCSSVAGGLNKVVGMRVSLDATTYPALDATGDYNE